MHVGLAVESIVRGRAGRVDDTARVARVMRRPFLAGIRLALIGFTVSCGGPYATPPAQTPSAPAAPTDVANVRGKWTGTLQGTNLSLQSITMDVVQTADCVDGAWNTDAAQ